jgi:hypothetical protein
MSGKAKNPYPQYVNITPSGEADEALQIVCLWIVLTVDAGAE